MDGKVLGYRAPLVLGGLVALVVIGWAVVAYATAPKRYVTWEGIGPDKWASIWLLRRHIDPGAEIALVPRRARVRGGTAFDVPGARFRRTASATTYESLAAFHGVTRDSAQRLADIVNELEISTWSIRSTSTARLVEQGFRRLQKRYGRESVPFACYMAFFDEVASRLEAGSLTGDANAEPPWPDEGCAEQDRGEGADPPTVAELPVDVVLQRLKRGEDVVFVDTREAAEFEEYHIPGARNIKLREIDEATGESLAGADLVVPYCVKDFRGYEVARALAKVGVRNTALLNPYGLKGWRKLGLPVAGSLARSEAAADRALRNCMEDIDSCVGAPL